MLYNGETCFGNVWANGVKYVHFTVYSNTFKSVNALLRQCVYYLMAFTTNFKIYNNIDCIFEM